MTSRIACALLAALPLAAQAPLDLGGLWERWLGDTLYDAVQVPSSYRPIGTARLHRTVSLPSLDANRRAALVFEGVANEAVVRWNGREVGRLGPWIGAEFDVTDAARAGDNALDVEITDWQVPLGPTGGWEAYGGIVRKVSLEFRPASYVDNARLGYKLAPGYGSAECMLDVFIRSTAARTAKLSAELRNGAGAAVRAEREVQVTAGASRLSLPLRVERPALWSPERPDLYTLRVQLASAAGESVFTAETGFRELRIEGSRFLLNGRPFVFKGVARHDLWKDQGYTLTPAQIEQDVQMIKSMGANSIRLVHYPHNRRSVEAAARAGLLVTEEPGLYWMDFAKASRESIERGLRNMEALIRRDWNSPALFAILLANESTPTVEVMREARERAKALAPGLFLSAAHIASPSGGRPASKRLFDDGGFDFYTYHPYTYDMGEIERAAADFTGKPLIFSEWGGPSGRMPVMLDQTVAVLSRLVRQGRLAGHWFWEWADGPEFSRKDVSMDDGILVEGVVTQDRTVRADVFARLATLYRSDPGPEASISREPRVLLAAPRSTAGAGTFTRIPLGGLAASAEQREAWKRLEDAMARYWDSNGFTKTQWQETGKRFWTWDAPQLRAGGVPFETAQVDGATRPLAVLPGGAVEIPVHAAAARLHILGNVTVPDGYPTVGRMGQAAGRYVVVYAGGKRQEFPLRWGVELARSNRIAVATRLNPVAVRAVPAVDYAKDVSRENYQTLLLTLPVEGGQIESLRVELEPGGAALPPSSLPNSTGSLYKAGEQILLLYAITAESE
ncbi:MAG TPA: glycoside hydrolase family 2 TIM barrel-domain containing protein [Bryobacteraceae bacterium]|nr:glycoside hydrolase family 2 TIM barrel-domain containing protein [Bryobacteraceae bacterium]